MELKPDESQQHYVLSIVANDRTGLLYHVANTLNRQGVDILTARVTTLGDRVEDSFLVSGAPLNNARTQLQIESELLQVLEVSD